MTISPEMRRIYATAPAGQKYIETLEFWHPDFGQRYYMTNDPRSWEFALETGQIQKFDAVPFALVLPRRDGEGRQDMNITIDNIGRELIAEIEKAADGALTPVEVTYRVYLNKVHSPPQNSPVLTLAVFQVEVTRLSVVATASRADILNLPFPGDVYRVDTFPGLDR